MNSERPRKNFKTADGTPEPANQNTYFGQPPQNHQSFQKQNFGGQGYGASNSSKKIKKPKNKLNLNKFHQPIFRKENEKKVLKKKARDLTRLIEKEDMPEEIKEAKQVELQEVNKQLEKKGKLQKRQDRKMKFLEQKYKPIMNVEMKKVTRALQKNEKQLFQTLDEDKKKTLLAEKKDLQMKYNYIKHFPKDKKYLSLFPTQENEKMVQLRTKIMKDIQSRVDQKERYLNKIELDPIKKDEKNNKKKDDEKKGKNKPVKDSEEESDDSEMDIEQQDDSSSDSEEDKKDVKMPKLGKKYVDNFFVAPNAKVDEKSSVKIVGRDGRVAQTQFKKKTLSDSDSDSSDEDSD